jgi:hypothetical protein
MSYEDGPICSTASEAGQPVSSSDQNYYFQCDGDTIRLSTPRTVTGTSTGYPGEWCWDSSFLYICVDTNTWKQISLVSF